MKESICRKDINGVQLREGDIVAEGKVNQEIWGGKAIIKSRPLGVVVVYDSPDLSSQYSPDETDMYNIHKLRKGEVQFTEKANKYLTKGGTVTECAINISAYDGDFFCMG